MEHLPTNGSGKDDWPRPRQVSDEEYNLRWDLLQGKIQMSSDEFNAKVLEIRQRTGKP